MEQQIYTNCLRCRRPLKNPVSMATGYGPVCRPRSGNNNQPDDDEDIFLTTIHAPMKFDVVLERTGELPGQTRTNVPHSVILHSPTGFEWGYAGSGPADLALNILNAFVPPGSDGFDPVDCDKGKASHTAADLHQRFKFEFITSISRDQKKHRIAESAITSFIERHMEYRGNDGNTG